MKKRIHMTCADTTQPNSVSSAQLSLTMLCVKQEIEVIWKKGNLFWVKHTCQLIVRLKGNKCYQELL